MKLNYIVSSFLLAWDGRKIILFSIGIFLIWLLNYLANYIFRYQNFGFSSVLLTIIMVLLQMVIVSCSWGGTMKMALEQILNSRKTSFKEVFKFVSNKLLLFMFLQFLLCAFFLIFLATAVLLGRALKLPIMLMNSTVFIGMVLFFFSLSLVYVIVADKEEGLLKIIRGLSVLVRKKFPILFLRQLFAFAVMIILILATIFLVKVTSLDRLFISSSNYLSLLMFFLVCIIFSYFWAYWTIVNVYIYLGIKDYE